MADACTILAFETATPSGGAALLVDGRVVGEFRIQGSQSHSALCLGFAETLLRQMRIEWNQVTAFAASHGPGAFTGVRVGLTLVKGLSFSTGRPVVTVNTLDAMALAGWSGESVDLVAPVQDARMGEIYTALLRPEGGRLVRASEDLVLAPAALVEKVGGRRTLLCGEGERSYAAEFPESQFPRARADRRLATAASVALLAAEAYQRGETKTAAQVEAIYLREAIQPR